jgi:murein endopeptidase
MAGVKVEETDESDPAGSATVQYEGKSWVIGGDALPWPAAHAQVIMPPHRRTPGHPGIVP